MYKNISADSDVSFMQWSHTDSIDLRRVTVSKEDFVKIIYDYVPRIVEHDFIYREQSKYISIIKTLFLKSKQALCEQVDFSQNFTCVAQNSSQVRFPRLSHHEVIVYKHFTDQVYFVFNRAFTGQASR